MIETPNGSSVNPARNVLMRVFVTGASGFMGSAIIPDLIAHGHSVVGVGRNDASAAEIEAAGAEVFRGSLEDPEGLARGAAAADGVIHLAFNHDFSRFAENGQEDKRAIEAMGEALAGTGKPMVVTSGTALLAPGRLATEDDPAAAFGPRTSEAAVFAFVPRNVRAMAVRLPPSTHGESNRGFRAGLTTQLIAIAQEKGFSALVGDGANRWSASHRLDAAPVYRLALEKGRAGRSYHPIAEEGVALRDIATAIGERLGVPVKSLSAEEAGEHLGFLAMFMGVDVPASSEITRGELGWTASRPGLIDDLKTGSYAH
jgi:nucleoside-diphosphate-sugar epimerase